MKPHTNDDLVRKIAYVHDDSLAGFENRPAARDLLANVTALGVTRDAPRLRRRLLVRAAVASGVAATVAAGAIVLTRGGSGPAGPSTVRASDVAQVTSLVASAARNRPDLHPRDDQFIHVKSVEVTVSADVFGKNGRHTVERLPRTNRELWLSVDGRRTGLLRQSPCPPRRSCDRPLPGDKRAGAPTPDSTAALRSLPTDPAKLLKAIDKIESGAGKARPQLRWETIQDLINEQYLPPKVRAALFEVIGNLPGATLDRNATDAIGRAGIAISVPDGLGGHNEMIFDRRTYQYLGSRSIAGPPADGKLITPFPGATPYRVPKGRPAAGTVTYASALLTVDVADHPTAR
ncbi:CU044_5270 family protein [Actinoallomurus purpureus]|uniref:CU044_5270 family protein n=1 Tax=Actinoallomurus purpureus TaxID=478114 RepID=UPI002092657C|nr:CU044_5270 family protein [Actinoallomurus purpureus]MCO6004907.1 CU044_5270 family protein [Actinoallomurus purpureus]